MIKKHYYYDNDVNINNDKNNQYNNKQKCRLLKQRKLLVYKKYERTFTRLLSLMDRQFPLVLHDWNYIFVYLFQIEALNLILLF